MKKILKIGFLVIYYVGTIIYVVLSIYPNIKEPKKAILVYGISDITIPIRLGENNINYFIRQFEFDNIGNEKANDVKVEITLPSVTSKNIATTESLGKDIIVKKTPSGIAVRSEDAQTAGWSGIFSTNELKSINSVTDVTDFRNNISEGNGIYRQDKEYTVFAYKRCMNPNEKGIIMVKSYFEIGGPMNFLFDSKEVQGVNINAYKPEKKLKFNLVILVIIILIGGIINFPNFLNLLKRKTI